MTLHYRWAIAPLALSVVIGGAVLFAGARTGAAGPADDDDANEVVVPAGTLDDGKDLIPLAAIPLDQAVAAATGAHAGALGEVDLEYYEGVLVYNIDVGDADVKVSANDGAVLAAVNDGD